MKSAARLIARARAQVRSAIFARITRAGYAIVQIDGLNDESVNDVSVMQHVGFASWLPSGASVVLLPINGKTTKGVVIASADGSTVQVAEGETIVYDQHGHTIRLGSTGITIKGDVQLYGNLNASGQVSDAKGSMDLMRITYNLHDHAVVDNSALPTTQVMQ